jgi:hydrogenase nickel incorporation protein HypA/HybF
MHELGVCQSLLKQVQAIAGRHGAPVRRVVLRVGPLSGVDPALLTRAYAAAAVATDAEGSELLIETPPLRVRCRRCGIESAGSLDRLTCAACGDWHTDLLSGNELLLLRVELEETTDV